MRLRGPSPQPSPRKRGEGARSARCGRRRWLQGASALVVVTCLPARAADPALPAIPALATYLAGRTPRFARLVLTLPSLADNGFSVPLQPLFRGAWRGVCEEAIGRTGDLAPFLDRAAVRSLWQSAADGRGSRRLAYTLVVLLLWLQQHNIMIGH